jgi:hypothetical protein
MEGAPGATSGILHGDMKFEQKMVVKWNGAEGGLGRCKILKSWFLPHLRPKIHRDLYSTLLFTHHKM